MIDRELSVLWPHPAPSGRAAGHHALQAIRHGLGAWRETIVVAGLLVAYLVLLYVPLPFASPGAAQAAIERAWWPWKVYDLVVTGGALSRASVLAVGALAIFATRNSPFPQFIGQVKLGWVEIAAGLVLTAVPAAAVTFGMILAGIIQPRLTDVVVSGLVLLAGAVFVEIVDVKLRNALRVGVLLVNAVAALGAYVTSLALGRELVASLVVLGAGLLFIVTYLIGQRRVEKVGVIDRATGFDEKADIVIPYSDGYIQHIFLFAWSLLASFLLVAVGLLAGLPLDLESATPINLVVLALLGVVFVLWVRRYGFISAFSPETVAHFLQRNIWVIPGVRPGKETEEVLRQRIGAIAQYWILFFAGWYVIFWLLERTAIRVGYATPRFPGGVLALMIVLSFVGYFFHVLIVGVRSLLQSPYSAGELKEIHFASVRAEADLELLARAAQLLPEPARSMLLAEFANAQSDTVSKTVLKLALWSLLPYNVDTVAVDVEVREGGLRRVLLRELKDTAIYGIGLAFFMIGILKLAGYTFGETRRDILLVVGPALWDTARSGRTRYILRLSAARAWAQLKAGLRRVGSLLPSGRTDRNLH